MFGMPRRAVWPRNALVIAVGCSGLNAEKMFVFREKSFFFVTRNQSTVLVYALYQSHFFVKEREKNNV